MPFELENLDDEFKVLTLAALSNLMGIFAGAAGANPEFQGYYTNAWLPRVRKLIAQLNDRALKEGK